MDHSDRALILELAQALAANVSAQSPEADLVDRAYAVCGHDPVDHRYDLCPNCGHDGMFVGADQACDSCRRTSNPVPLFDWCAS